MRRFIAVLAVASALAFAVATVPGCADDVKKVKKVETHQESQPQMVSPGETIVE